MDGGDDDDDDDDYDDNDDAEHDNADDDADDYDADDGAADDWRWWRRQCQDVLTTWNNTWSCKKRSKYYVYLHEIHIKYYVILLKKKIEDIALATFLGINVFSYLFLQHKTFIYANNRLLKEEAVPLLSSKWIPLPPPPQYFTFHFVNTRYK